MAEYNFGRERHMQLQSTNILSTKSCYMNDIIIEAMDTEFQPSNLNREDGLFSGRSWGPLFHSLKNGGSVLQQRHHLIRELSSGIKDLSNNVKSFKAALKNFLLANMFYTVDDF